MPPVIGLVLLGAGLWAGYKALSRVVERVAADLAHADEVMRREGKRSPEVAEKDLGSLIFDPQSGVYKPRDV
jgi:hypothetical protein